MGTIKIVNNSTLTDCSAVMRIGMFLAGDEYSATRSENGEVIIAIKKLGSGKCTYIVTDYERPSLIQVAKELAVTADIDYNSIK